MQGILEGEERNIGATDQGGLRRRWSEVLRRDSVVCPGN